jgi:hypothetical protein
MNKPLYQSDESYRRTLMELERRVNAGVRLEYYDSEQLGAKNTECTLGLCHDSIEAMQDGVYRDKGHACPHDERYFTADGKPTGAARQRPTGCFYYCNVFQGTKQERKLAQQRIRAVTTGAKAGAS